MPCNGQTFGPCVPFRKNLPGGQIGSVVDIGRGTGMGSEAGEASGSPSGVVGAGSGMGATEHSKRRALAVRTDAIAASRNRERQLGDGMGRRRLSAEVAGVAGSSIGCIWPWHAFPCRRIGVPCRHCGDAEMHCRGPTCQLRVGQSHRTTRGHGCEWVGARGRCRCAPWRLLRGVQNGRCPRRWRSQRSTSF